MSSPLHLAVDTTERARAEALVAAARPHLGGLKLGLEWFCRHGPEGTRALAEASGLPLFLDLKFHDIPNTVAAAVRAVAPLRPSILTVHAGGGRDMMAAARDAAPAATRVVAVTVLTSLDDADLAAAGVAGGTAAQAERLAGLARAAGLDGCVCSPHEVRGLRAAWPEALLVVPGVRPAGAGTHDQKRVMTPAEALAAGASVVVVGRPITAAADPAAAAAAIAAELGF
ncbi:MAG: orotidine-5'-phosphate decarboxylase [Thermaurantiacus tibetensis]